MPFWGRFAWIRIAVGAGAIALIVAAVLGAGCHKGELERGGDLVVWLSADTRGYLEPCGCRKDQAGGLPARMTLIAFSSCNRETAKTTLCASWIEKPVLAMSQGSSFAYFAGEKSRY